MAITFIYPAGKPNFPRSYIKGVVGSAGVINLAVAGSTVSFNYIDANTYVEYKMYAYFWPFSSNFYSLDFVFDPTASQGYSFGVPVPSTQGIKFHAMTTEPAYRIQVLATLSVDETQTADFIPPPSTYWRYPP